MRKLKHKIAVIGAGKMGTALAQVAASKRNTVALWNYDGKILRKIEENKQNPCLRGVKLSDRIHCEDDINEAVRHAEVVILAVSSPYVRQMARLIAPTLKSGAIVVDVAKGLEVKSKFCMADVIAEEIPEKLHKKITVISGPSMADEFAQEIPTAVVMASRDKTVFPVLRKYLQTPCFRLAGSQDLYGVSFAGTSKNVYAIALGLCEGLKMKTNAKAWMATVAFDEITKIIKAVDGDESTALGLAGLGDFLVTGFGPSRNYKYGVSLGDHKKGRHHSKDQALTIEGINSCKAVYSLIKKSKMKLPLLEMLYSVLHRGKNPKNAVTEFFANVRLK
jgi:glycerol-3-phosphate dehydrogenase (NAD(P)+)